MASAHILGLFPRAAEQGKCSRLIFRFASFERLICGVRRVWEAYVSEEGNNDIGYEYGVNLSKEGNNDLTEYLKKL